MSTLILPTGYTSQPQVNAPLNMGHPLMRGTTPMMVVNGQALTEISANKPLIVGGTMTRVDTYAGRALDNDTGGRGDVGVIDGILNTDACVDFWYGQYLNNGVNGQYAYGDYNANGLGLALAHSGIAYNLGWYDGTVLNDAGFALTHASYNLFVIVREANGGVHRVYMNGRLVITGANAGATGGKLAFGSLGQGLYTSGTLNAATRTLLFGRLYGRGWSAAEAAQFSRNPWQILKAPTRRLYFGTGAAGTTPNITSVSTGTPREGASLTITGTAFGASQGSGDVKINGVAQTVTSWSDTSIAVTIVLGTNKFGAAYTVVVRDNALTASNSYAGITGLLPANSGLSYVDIGTPNTTSAYRLTATADLVSGDQVEYENKGSGVTVATDGTFTAAAGIASFSARAWTTGSGYGAAGVQLLINTGSLLMSNSHKNKRRRF